MHIGTKTIDQNHLTRSHQVIILLSRNREENVTDQYHTNFCQNRESKINGTSQECRKTRLVITNSRDNLYMQV